MKRLCLVLILLAASFVYSHVSYAQYSSSNYKANEVRFGAGGGTASSTNYQSTQSIGDLGVGNASSTNYQAYSGFLTPNEPFLELTVDTSTVNLGTLDSTSTKTGTATFHVRAYIDSGYTVQTIGQGLKMVSGSANHTITNLSTAGAPTVGTEQFGINLVANTSPASFGANPSPQPNSTFATGQAASGYDTANTYKYVPGAVIAQTNGSGWGQTNYTISYIANISPITPAGSYMMTQDLVVVATY